MGGNALKEFSVKRLQGVDYDVASHHAERVINDIMAEYGIKDVARLSPSWRNKTDHGDVDLIVPMALKEIMSHDKLLSEMAKHFRCEVHGKSLDQICNVTAPHPKGGHYQLDLIFIREESLDFAQAFYSWGDVSTLLLRLAANLRVHIGPNGLSYKAKNGKTTMGRVILTRDFETAITHMGLDYSRWRDGFDNLTQVYEWFTDCKYFSDPYFLLEGMNMGTRKDVQKRPGYMGFLHWLKSHPEVNKKYQWTHYVEQLPESLWVKFPEAKHAYDAFFDEIQKNKDAQNKFNGHLIGATTGLSGKDLGNFITDFKKGYDKSTFQTYVINTSPDEINKAVIDHFQNYRRS